MSGLTAVDGLLVDDDTGEVVEWPEGAPAFPVDRIEYLTRQAFGAQQAEKDSKLAYDTYRRAIGVLLSEYGEAALTTDAGRATRVSEGTQQKAPAPQVRAAVDAELMTNDQAMDLLITAAKELDVEAVRAWVAKHAKPERAKALGAVLVVATPRAGYVRLYQPKAAPPRVERREKVATE